jgi:hypothetical protein
MSHKIFATGVAMLAFAAFAVVPSVASATSPELVNKAGTAVAKGAALKAESSNLVLSSAKGNIECEKNILEGTVTKNEAKGEAIEAEFTKGSFTGKAEAGKTTCKTGIKPYTGVELTSENMGWCFKTTSSGAAMEWELKTCAAGKEVLFRAQFFENGAPRLTCTYGRTTVTGTYNTPNTEKGEKTHLIVGGSQSFTRIFGNESCPPNMTLSGEFGLFSGAGEETMIQ